MNDRERKAEFLKKLDGVDGLDERRFRQLMSELERVNNRLGYDDQGRLKVAMFDAKSYDIESFQQRNQGRFAIHPIQASLTADTATAAQGCKVVCIFVNDACDASIVSRLAAQGVELIALRSPASITSISRPANNMGWTWFACRRTPPTPSPNTPWP